LDQTLQQVQPALVRWLVNIQVEVNAEQEFAFHAVDFCQLDTRDLGPGLVGVGVAENHFESIYAH
jgi:hypothetical protein